MQTPKYLVPTAPIKECLRDEVVYLNTRIIYKRRTLYSTVRNVGANDRRRKRSLKLVFS